MNTIELVLMATGAVTLGTGPILFIIWFVWKPTKPTARCHWDVRRVLR